MFNGREQLIIALIISIYFIFLFVLSFYMKRETKTYEDYNVAGRSVSMFPLILTFIGTGVGGATLIGYMENGYILGMGEQWIHITIFSAVIIFASFLLKRIRAIGEKYNMITIGDYTALLYGEKARIPTAISYLFSYCAMTGMEFVAIASILNLTIGLNMTVGIFVGWILLTIKTYLGGLKAVIWQDVIQGLILSVGVIVLFFTVLKVSGGWQTVVNNAGLAHEEEMLNIFNITPNEIMIYLFTLAFYQFIRQDLWQRVWAAKSLNIARSGYWISMVVAVGIGAIVVAIGIFSHFGLNLGKINSELVYYHVIQDVFPFSFTAIMIIVLLAAVISTADSFFIAGSSSVVNDIIKPNVKNPTDRKMLLYSRISVLIVSMIALVLSLTIPGLVNLMVTGTAMTVSALLAPILCALLWKTPPKVAGLASMWSGLITAVLWQVLGHPFGVHPVMIGLPVSIVILIIATVFSKDRSTNKSLKANIH